MANQLHYKLKIENDCSGYSAKMLGLVRVAPQDESIEKPYFTLKGSSVKRAYTV